jgi:hypothetical protein
MPGFGGRSFELPGSPVAQSLDGEIEYSRLGTHRSVLGEAPKLAAVARGDLAGGVAIPDGLAVQQSNAQSSLELRQLPEQSVERAARCGYCALVHGHEHESIFADRERRREIDIVSRPSIDEGLQLIRQPRSILGREIPVAPEYPESRVGW